jgi:MGT family glycosyltransferase
MLFTSTPGFGSFHPAMALACAAKAGDHDVAFATADERRDVIERSGLTFLPAGRDATTMRAMTVERYPDLRLPGTGAGAPPTDRESRKRGRRLFFGDLCVEAMLPGLLEAIRRWRPDVLIRTHLAYAGWIAAEETGIPYVTVEEYASGEPGWSERDMSSTLNGWRERRGLTPDPELARLHRYLTIVPFPPSLRHADSPFPPTARRTEPLLFSGPLDDGQPGWVEALPKPIVHASLGTVVDRLDLLRTIVEGATNEVYSLILATGPSNDPTVLGPMPSNVRTVPYLSHALLLPHCDAVITHAGAGTLIASIDAGCPMVFVPLFGDQPANAERAAAVGAGIVLDRDALTAHAVRDAVRAVLRDERYRRAVEGLQREIAGLPTHAEAVGWVAEIARTRTPLPSIATWPPDG